MTFWSRHDPVMMRQGQTDYWSKMKLKCTTLELAMPSGTVVSHAGHKVSQQSPPKSQHVATFEFNKNGTLTQIPDKTFNDLVARQLHGNLPGNYSYNKHNRTIRTNSASGSASLKTSFNTKAKEGFNYWNIDRPKPTKFGNMGIGAANMILKQGKPLGT